MCLTNRHRHRPFPSRPGGIVCACTLFFKAGTKNQVELPGEAATCTLMEYKASHSYYRVLSKDVFVRDSLSAVFFF